MYWLSWKNNHFLNQNLYSNLTLILRDTEQGLLELFWWVSHASCHYLHLLWCVRSAGLLLSCVGGCDALIFPNAGPSLGIFIFAVLFSLPLFHSLQMARYLFSLKIAYSLRIQKDLEGLMGYPGHPLWLIGIPGSIVTLMKDLLHTWV